MANEMYEARELLCYTGIIVDCCTKVPGTGVPVPKYKIRPGYTGSTKIPAGYNCTHLVGVITY